MLYLPVAEERGVFMKKVLKTIGIIFVLLVAAGIYYYVTLPAINIHSSGFWMFLFILLVALFLLYLLKKGAKFSQQMPVSEVMLIFKKSIVLKLLFGAAVVLVVCYAVGSILSSPIINAARYQKLLNIEERTFVEDIKEVDYNTIPLLDKNSASLLGDRKMGSMVDMVSQFEVGSDYTQINYQSKPVRVTPLVYASTIKWFTNQSQGIPAYILIDMATQETECIKLEDEIKYSKSEYFNRNLNRHLRFNFPTYIFDEQIFFEIDDDGTPFWVCPVKKFNIGLFGGQTIGRVVLCNAVTGECIDYAVEDVPQWVDKVFSAELLMELYDYAGIYVNGFFNSILGQRDCLRSTNGYNYIALDDDVWVYTGVTSVNGDQSNVGFVLMNQRTMETRYYRCEGAIEDSAMSSAQGKVQNLGYQATFPLLLNIANEPTYFMALKDNAGLVKKYAMVNVSRYQDVAIGDTIRECEKEYVALLSESGIVVEDSSEMKTVTGTIEAVAPVVIEGTTHYYLCLERQNAIYDVDLSNTELLDVIRYQAGDKITLQYMEGESLCQVRQISAP